MAFRIGFLPHTGHNKVTRDRFFAIISFKEAFQLAERSVVLLNCPLIPDIIHLKIFEAFHHFWNGAK
jgi:hypothetical protein